MVRGRNVDLARVHLDRSIVDLRARYAHDRDPRLRRVRRDEETVSGQRACTKVRRSDTFLELAVAVRSMQAFAIRSRIVGD